MASAFKIKKECLSKSNVLAGTAVSLSTSFDWTDEVLNDFNIQSVPVLKRSCRSSAGSLNSFRIVMSGYDKSKNILSNSAGPSETGKCGNTRAPSTEAPSKGEIWYDDKRI